MLNACKIAIPIVILTRPLPLLLSSVTATAAGGSAISHAGGPLFITICQLR